MNPHINNRLTYRDCREIRQRTHRENIIAATAVVVVLSVIVAAWYWGLTR